METSFQSKLRDKCCCSEHPLASWSNPSLISKVVCSKSTCYWLQYRENWLAHMQDCNFGKSVSFNILFAARWERGCREEKGCEIAKQGRMPAFSFSQSSYLLKHFAKSKRWITALFLESDATLFFSLWACSQLVSFCRLGKLWFAVWAIWTQQSDHKFWNFQSTTLGVCSFRMRFGRWQ